MIVMRSQINTIIKCRNSPPPPPYVITNNTVDVSVITLGVQSPLTLVGPSASVGLNEYQTHEMMIFDSPHDLTSASVAETLTLKNGETTRDYARTAHSSGEMFGLKFWENWYILGQVRVRENQ